MPSFNVFVWATNLSLKELYILLKISIRLPAAHLCPALLNADSVAQWTAWSKSASSQTIKGFFPPSSKEILAKRLPAICAIFLPTIVEPVKLINEILGFEDMDNTPLE